MDLLKRQEMLENAKKRISSSGKPTHGDKQKSSKIGARIRMTQIFDEDTFSELGAYIKARPNDTFTADSDDYEGVICGYGAIDGRLVFAYSQESSRLNGAFGKAAADKICSLFDLAKKNAAPVICIFDSDGAKLTEGLDVLDGYGRVMKKISEVKGKIPLLSYICGNASGAAAVISSMSDITIMAANVSTLSLAPASVLKNAGGNENIATGEYVSQKGTATIVVETEQEVFAKGREILYYLPSNKLDRNIYTEVIDNPDRKTPEIAQIVSQDSYDMHKVISCISDGGKYLELYDKSGIGVICCFTVLNGIPCGIVANTGKDLCFGSMKKASEFINLCNNFELPLVTLVDCKGFSYECEAKGGKILSAAADLAFAYTNAKIPLITVNIGCAYGSVFTIMGSKSVGADIVYALDSSKIAIMNPESGIRFMWNDKLSQGKNKEELTQQWELSASSPLTAANYGYVDDILSADVLRQKILSAVEMLSMKSEFVSLF